MGISSTGREEAALTIAGDFNRGYANGLE